MTFDPIKFRHLLHAQAELSSFETKTSTLIINALKDLGYQKIHTGFSMYSIVVEIEGVLPGPTLLFRCELDALPIHEENDVAHRSLTDGVSHKCGHDGHAAILLSLAQKLKEKPPLSGKVLLFFQSAEETGSGAKAVMNSAFFDQFQIDYAFALHNIPGFKKDAFLLKKGLFTPCVESCLLKLKGKTSHASEPQKGINPALAITEIIGFFESLNQPLKSRDDFYIATPVYLQMGEQAFGTSAGEATMGYTLRTWHAADFEKSKSIITDRLTSIAAIHQLNLEIDWLESFVSNFNDESAIDHCITVINNSKFDFIELDNPFEFGEDFGLFTQKFKGAMLGLGSGVNHPALHTANYDFEDDLIDIGAEFFKAIIEAF